MSKGAAEYVGITVVAFAVIAAVASLGIDNLRILEDRIALNTVSIPGERIEAGAYALDSVDQGSLQMKMRDEYNITEQDGKEYLLYRYTGVVPGQESQRRFEIDPPVTIRVSEEGKSRYVCLRKRSVVTISSGEC